MIIPDVTNLKIFLLDKYNIEIKIIINLLCEYFDEKVDVHYTFEDYDSTSVFCFDLDFYLVKNKNNLSLGYSGKKKLAVCFVIMPPLYKTEKTHKFILGDEGVYLINNLGKKDLYRKYVTNFSWIRLFNISIKSLKKELKLKTIKS